MCIWFGIHGIGYSNRMGALRGMILLSWLPFKETTTSRERSHFRKLCLRFLRTIRFSCGKKLAFQRYWLQWGLRIRLYDLPPQKVPFVLTKILTNLEKNSVVRFLTGKNFHFLEGKSANAALVAKLHCKEDYFCKDWNCVVGESFSPIQEIPSTCDSINGHLLFC